MAEWVWVESPGTGVTREPRVRVSAFGDGYQQRAPDGLNNDAQTWEYQATDVDDAVAADMMAFLETHGAVTPFDYTPLWATTPIKVVCPTWRRTLGSRVGTSDISATFNQWFGA